MWRLLRTEIKYNRVLLGVLLGMYAPYLVIFALFGAGEIEKIQTGMMVFMWSLSVVMSVFYMMDMAKTRRTRLHAVIPLPPLIVSLTRILIFLGFWGVMSAGFWAAHLIFHASLFKWKTLYGFMSLSGIVFFIHASYLLALDVRSWLVKKWIFNISAGGLIGSIIPAVLMGSFVLVFISQGVFGEKIGIDGERFFSSLPGGLLFLALGLAVSVLDIAAYSRRRFYME